MIFKYCSVNKDFIAMTNNPQIELSPDTIKSLKASTKAIEELGFKLGQIGTEAQKKIVESINQSAQQIKPVKFDL